MTAGGSIGADILPLREEHFPELRGVLDAVAREGRYLAFLQAPPEEEAFAFYRGIIERDCPHFVALVSGRVVGWCDVLPAHGESRAHVGILGIGLLPAFRGWQWHLPDDRRHRASLGEGAYPD